MLIKERQVDFLAKKIAYDLLNSKLVTFPKTIDNAIKEITQIIKEDVEWERDIENRARDILAKQEEENEYLLYDVDRREVFKLIKKNLAEEEGFSLNKYDRLDELSAIILKELWDNELIDYDVRDGKIKNLIFKSIQEFLNKEIEVRDAVYNKIANYKRKLIPGSEEYEILFNKLYEEEMKRRGLS